jgi:hypothetical protein
MSAYFCGSDVQKDPTYAAIIDYEGKVVGQRRIVSDRVLSYFSGCWIDRAGISLKSGSTTAQADEKGYDISVSQLRKTRYIAEVRYRVRVDSSHS